MEYPGKVIYTDGYASRLEEQDVFLCPSDYNINFHFPASENPNCQETRQLQSLSILSGSLLS